jgi:recombinational DNA repair protein RecR
MLAIRALRSYDKPLESAAQARAIPGIGEKTAAKVRLHLFSVAHMRC